MGTIFKRDDNAGVSTYQARIRKKGLSTQSKTFGTKREAELWIAEIESHTNRSGLVDTRLSDSTTLGDLLDRYGAEVSIHKPSHKQEKIRIKALKKRPIASYFVSSCTPKLIGEWRDKRQKTVSGSTVLRDLALLGNLFEIARKEWGIGPAVNPVREIRKPKQNAPRQRRLDPQEEKAILAESSAARNDYLRPVVEIALETGMRQGEIVGLEWSLIDLEKRTIHLLKTKNGDDRGIPLSNRAIEILKQVGIQKKGRVFPALTAEALKRSFIRACKRAEIEDFHFHDLRHEATSRFFELGLDSMEVASITGHKTMSMLKRYTHLAAADLAKKLK